MTKKKPKVKIVYRNAAVPKEPHNEAYFGKESQKGLKKEITELEEKKKASPKGFKGFIQKASINRAINQRRAILGSAKQAELVKIKTSVVKAHVELQENQNKLQELRKRNQVDFSGINSLSPAKQIKLEDLY